MSGGYLGKNLVPILVLIAIITLGISICLPFLEKSLSTQNNTVSNMSYKDTVVTTINMDARQKQITSIIGESVSATIIAKATNEVSNDFDLYHASFRVNDSQLQQLPLISHKKLNIGDVITATEIELAAYLGDSSFANILFAQ